jgi:hypothetical protein
MCVQPVTRAFIGGTRADQFRYPPARTFGALPMLRLKNQVGDCH